MSSATDIKTDWTWEAWQASRARRRAVAAKIGPPVVRRRASSSDRRLRKAFDGERGPDFTDTRAPVQESASDMRTAR